MVSLIFSFSVDVIFFNWTSVSMWFLFLFSMGRAAKVNRSACILLKGKGCTCVRTELLWEKEVLERDCPSHASAIELHFQECGSNRRVSSCHGITKTQNNPFYIVVIVFTLTKCFEDKHSQVCHGVPNFHETLEKFSHSLELCMPVQDSMLRSATTRINAP